MAYPFGMPASASAWLSSSRVAGPFSPSRSRTTFKSPALYVCAESDFGAAPGRGRDQRRTEHCQQPVKILGRHDVEGAAHQPGPYDLAIRHAAALELCERAPRGAHAHTQRRGEEILRLQPARQAHHLRSRICRHDVAVLRQKPLSAASGDRALAPSSASFSPTAPRCPISPPSCPAAGSRSHHRSNADASWVSPPWRGWSRLSRMRSSGICAPCLSRKPTLQGVSDESIWSSPASIGLAPALLNQQDRVSLSNME